MEMHNPSHPGVVLNEWLEGISVTAAAEKLGVSRLSLSKILNESGGISPDMDLRLSKAPPRLASTLYSRTNCPQGRLHDQR